MHLPVDVLTLMGFDFPFRRCGCGQIGFIENYLFGRGVVWLYQHYYHQLLQASEIIALWELGYEQAHEHVERSYAWRAVESALFAEWLDSGLERRCDAGR